MSRMTIVTTGSEDVIEQITKQLNKLIEVVKVIDLSEAEHIERELMLIKVRAGRSEREDMKRMADIFRGRIIDVSDNTYTIELTGDTRKLDAFIRSLDQGAIIETVRTGQRHRAGQPRPARLVFQGKSMKVYYDKDADLSLVKGKKVTIIGYGSQGHAHAQNLQESGSRSPSRCARAAPRGTRRRPASRSPRSPRRSRAPTSSWCLLPDEHHAQVYKEFIEPNIKKGASLAFAHGFNIHYGLIQPRADLDVWMVAPKAPGRHRALDLRRRRRRRC